MLVHKRAPTTLYTANCWYAMRPTPATNGANVRTIGTNQLGVDGPAAQVLAHSVVDGIAQDGSDGVQSEQGHDIELSEGGEGTSGEEEGVAGEERGDHEARLGEDDGEEDGVR